MNLKETFNKELLPQLKEKLGIDNVMAVPKLTKVVINMGVGEALTDKKHLESAVNDLELIAGQKAVITKVIPKNIRNLMILFLKTERCSR